MVGAILVPGTSDAQSNRGRVMAAAKDGDAATLERVLADDDSAVSDRTLARAAMWATRRNHVAALGKLLDHGVDVDSRSLRGATPLMWAARRGHPEAVNYLIRRGAAVDSANGAKRTALFWAAEQGHDDVARLLIKAGAAVNAGKRRTTPVVAAAAGGHRSMLALLASSGAALRERPEVLEQAILAAAGARHCVLARTLLGPDAGSAANMPQVAYWLARPREEIGKCLSAPGQAAVAASRRASSVRTAPANRPAHQRMVSARAAAGDRRLCIELARRMAQSGLPADLYEVDGKTALFLAAQTGCATLVRSLIDVGVDPDQVLDDHSTLPGWTSVMIAAAEGHAAAVGVLADAGADVDGRNRRGRTAMMFAALYGYTDVVHTLLAAGASTAGSDDLGQSAEGLAQAAGHAQAVTMLQAASIR